MGDKQTETPSTAMKIIAIQLRGAQAGSCGQ